MLEKKRLKLEIRFCVKKSEISFSSHLAQPRVQIVTLKFSICSDCVNVFFVPPGAVMYSFLTPFLTVDLQSFIVPFLLFFFFVFCFLFFLNSVLLSHFLTHFQFFLLSVCPHLYGLIPWVFTFFLLFFHPFVFSYYLLSLLSFTPSFHCLPKPYLKPPHCRKHLP